MKKMMFALLAVAVFSAQPLMAQEVKIAVIDVQAAIMGSEQAKQRIAEIKRQYAPDETQLRLLGEEIQKLQAKGEQDAAVMSESEKRRLGKDIDDKIVDYQFMAQKLQKSFGDGQQELLAELSPKLEQAIRAIIDEGTYDVILQRQSLIYGKPELDITKRVTERLNLIK